MAFWTATAPSASNNFCAENSSTHQRSSRLSAFDDCGKFDGLFAPPSSRKTSLDSRKTSLDLLIAQHAFYPNRHLCSMPTPHVNSHHSHGSDSDDSMCGTAASALLHHHPNDQDRGTSVHAASCGSITASSSDGSATSSARSSFDLAPPPNATSTSTSCAGSARSSAAAEASAILLDADFNAARLRASAQCSTSASLLFATAASGRVSAPASDRLLHPGTSGILGCGVLTANGSRTLLPDLPEQAPLPSAGSAFPLRYAPSAPRNALGGASSCPAGTSTFARAASCRGGDSAASSGSDEDSEAALTKALSGALCFGVGATQLRRQGSLPPARSISGPLGGDGAVSFPESHRAASDDGFPCGSPPLRLRSSYHLTNNHAAVELFLRLNHARQTLDFVKRQAASFAALDKAELGVWEALGGLSELREYEAPLMGGRDASTPEMNLLEHAFQTAELCRLAHPKDDWFHLVGLIHGLGKLLAHERWGSQPQWAVCGETYPVGCRFSPQVAGSHFFIANPDRRRRQLNTPLGMYTEHCGLSNVYMSWGAAEYLYLVLALNDTALPPEALFIVRHQKFRTLLPVAGGASTTPVRSGSAGSVSGSYSHLLSHAGGTTASSRPAGSGGVGGGGGVSGSYTHLQSADDRRMLPLLAEFQAIAEYRDVGPLPAGALYGAERRAYYDGLITKYLGPDKLFW